MIAQQDPGCPQVHLFGPGYGECALVHLGAGDWMVIDSCVDQATKRPVALAYLEEQGIAPAAAVRVIVATHWHDDHVRGLAKVVQACPAAKFVCSQALLSEDFVTLVRAASSRSMMESTSGVDEFNDVLVQLRGRPKQPNTIGSGLVLTGANTRIWRRDGTAEVWSLSPSAAENEAAIAALANLMPAPTVPSQPPKRRIPSIRPNNTAVVLWVRLGDAQMLFGADLEQIGNYQDVGWSAIVASSERPPSRATLFKVAHHGSENGHHDPVWTSMLAPTPVAILTPFQNGSVLLPTDSDKTRIRQRSGASFISSNRARRKPRTASRAVLKSFQESTKRIREVAGPGRISATYDAAASTWVVDLVGGAVPL